jgi:hypothetical protein
MEHGDTGRSDVLHVLVLMQVAAGLLAMFGELLLMAGNPIYAVAPVAKAVALLLLAAKVGRGRRWAIIAMIVVQLGTVVGFWLGVVVGLLPWVDYTVNLVGLLMNLALPAAVAYLCASVLAARPAATIGQETLR